MVHVVLAGAVLIALFGKKKSKYFFVAACTVLFLFAALRYMYGNDYYNYFQAYLASRAGYPVFDEYLYELLCRLIPSFFLLVALSSAAFVYCIYRLIIGVLDTEHAWMGLLIFVISPYLFLMNLSAIRQCMAMICFIIAVHFAIRKKFLLYLIMITAGALFHKSAVLLLPVWFVLNEKPVRRRTMFAVVLMLFVLLIFVDVNGVVLSVAKQFDDVNYVYYASSGRGNSLRATLLTAIIFLYVLGNLPNLQGRTLVYGKLYLVGLTLGILAIHVSMLTRIQMYFDIFAIVTLPAIYKMNRESGPVLVRPKHVFGTLWDLCNKYFLPILIFTVYVLRYYSFFTNPMWQSFYTYRTIFSVL